MRYQLSTRDLVNVVVFTVVYFILMFGFGALGILGPIAVLAGAFIAVLINGMVLVLLMARVRKMYSLTIVGAIVGIGMVATGHYWGTLILAVLLGLIADLIVTGPGRARPLRAWRAILAYAVFSLWDIGPMLPVIFNSRAYYAEIAKRVSPEYVHRFQQIFSPTTVGIIALVTLILGLIGGYLGVAAHRKHFQRAGLAD